MGFASLEHAFRSARGHRFCPRVLSISADTGCVTVRRPLQCQPLWVKSRASPRSQGPRRRWLTSRFGGWPEGRTVTATPPAPAGGRGGLPSDAPLTASRLRHLSKPLLRSSVIAGSLASFPSLPERMRRPSGSRSSRLQAWLEDGPCPLSAVSPGARNGSGSACSPGAAPGTAACLSSTWPGTSLRACLHGIVWPAPQGRMRLAPGPAWPPGEAGSPVLMMQ